MTSFRIVLSTDQTLLQKGVLGRGCECLNGLCFAFVDLFMETGSAVNADIISAPSHPSVYYQYICKIVLIVVFDGASK